MMTDYAVAAINLIWYFLDFMYSGGYVLWSIFFLNIILWTLVLERYWYFQYVYPVKAKKTLSSWLKRHEYQSWYAKNIKIMMLSRLKENLNKNLNSIHVFVEVLPVLGLLGTVIGMIETFDVLNAHGTGNARALADSISKALITTLAGLLSAIPGLFISSLLQQQAQQKIDKISEKMAFL